MVKLRTGRPDPVIKKINAALERYQAAHPQAEIEIYRQNSVSVRIRIIDPRFTRLSRTEREQEIWAEFDQLSEDVVAEISLLLLLTPKEAKKSLASSEFDNPIPSRL
ncbi:MAG: hypothetical protein HY000_17675 [Planctomycetes bacterium]|nr:hypothetical protein [Planctomycetota bacterium]